MKVLLPTRCVKLPIRRSNRTWFYLDASRRERRVRRTSRRVDHLQFEFVLRDVTRRDACDATLKRLHIVNPALLFYRLRFSPNSDCICTESNLHVFCSKRYTGSVSISIETSAKSKIRIHSAYPGPRNKDCT